MRKFLKEICAGEAERRMDCMKRAGHFGGRRCLIKLRLIEADADRAKGVGLFAGHRGQGAGVDASGQEQS